MEVYTDKNGTITCEDPGPETTVGDLADAVARFCLANIDCAACTNTCCAGLAVYADNVFVSKLRQVASLGIGEGEAAGLPGRVLRFDQRVMKWYVPQEAGGRCRFLARSGRCLIYYFRPLVCRLHLCRKSGADYAGMKEHLYFAYQQALTVEMAGGGQGGRGKAPGSLAAGNPVVGMDSYDAPIRHIVEWVRTVRQDG